MGSQGGTPEIKSSKCIADNLRSNSAKRNFVTISVSRNARFRGVRGENSNPSVLQKDTAVSSCDTHQCPVGGHQQKIDNNNLKNNKLKQR